MSNIAADNFIYRWMRLQSTDVEQRYIANFIFGVLGGDESDKHKNYLFASRELTATNSSTVAFFFDDCVKDLGKVNQCFSKTKNFVKFHNILINRMIN